MIKEPWIDINIDTYIEIRRYLRESKDEVFEKLINIENFIGITSKTDPIWEEMTTYDYAKRLKENAWMFRKAHSLKPTNEFNFDNIKFGEYIDCFTYLQKEQYENFLNVIDIDPTPNYLEYCIEGFSKYYENLSTEHKKIYGKGDDSIKDQEEEIKKIKNRKERSQALTELNNKKAQQKMSWLSLAYILCEEDITKFDQVMNMSNNLAHNWLSMKIARSKGFV